jgi:hypothetical protein
LRFCSLEKKKEKEKTKGETALQKPSMAADNCNIWASGALICYKKLN